MATKTHAERLRLAPYVWAVLGGETMHSQAAAAGVDTQTLRRLVVKHPDYAKAVAEGKVTKGNSKPEVPATFEQIRASAVMQEVAAGDLTQVAAAEKLGVSQPTIHKWLAIGWPELVKK